MKTISFEKIITVNGNGTTIAVPSSSKVVFRATDGITLNKDFEFLWAVN